MGGVFIAVVGKSGVGKDAVMTAARQHLEGMGPFCFPRRVITRPENAGGEDHISATEAGFLASAEAGHFILWWSAHGHHYGVPSTVADMIDTNAAVILNISRGAVQEARHRFERVAVIEVTARAETIEIRLKSRGRETENEIAERQARTAHPDWADGVPHHLINNDGSLEEAADAFVQAVLNLSGQTVPKEQTV